MWTLALFELSHNLLCIMGVAAYLWKKKIKTPANEPCLKISTEFTWKENSLKFCLMKRWVWNTRQNTQSSFGNTTLRGQALVCPPGILALQEYFQGKRQKQILKTCIKGGKGTENVFDPRGQFVADL